MRCRSCDHEAPPGTLITSQPDPGDGEAYRPIMVCADRDGCAKRSAKNVEQLLTPSTQGRS